MTNFDIYEKEFKRCFKEKDDEDFDHGDLGSVFVYIDGKTYEVIGSLFNGYNIALRNISTNEICFIKREYIFDYIRD